MRSVRCLIVCSAFAVVVAASPGVRPGVVAAEDKKVDGTRPLFNGKNLDGWALVNTHPDTFFVKDGEIVTTGTPMGFLRTDRQYENFVLEMDWMHVNKKEVGNSGLFVWGDPLPAVGTVYTRGIEVQVLINYPKVDWATNHGDLFSIWGAKCVPDRPHPKGYERCLPSEERVKGGGEWNHYKVTANDGAIKLEVNGKEVSGVSKCNPRKGYLALESEGAECHFKNLTIKELPSTNPKPEEVAKVSEGHVSLFNALDLKGWEDKGKDSWKVKDGKLIATGNEPLAAEKHVATGELTFDWKLPAKSTGWPTAAVGPVTVTLVPTGFVYYAWKIPGGGDTTGMLETKPIKTGGWNRTVVHFDGKAITIRVNGEEFKKVNVGQKLAAEPIRLVPAEGLEVMNVFFRETKEGK